MSPVPRNPKELSTWMELDYFRRRRLFHGPWRWLPLLTLLAALAGVACTFLPALRVAYEAAPVSTAHAMFDHDCGHCHTEAFRPLARLVHSDPALRSVPDTACLQCHPGPPHHDTALGAPPCATCHNEHRGRPSLARADEMYCTACHADLPRHDRRTPEYAPHVTGFAPDRHPEFRLWAKSNPHDPGTIAFSHASHLVADGVWDIDRRQLDLQRGQLEKMGKQPHLEPLPRRRVKLECASCHEPEADGRYMRPIDYERHCQSCHPLSVQLVGDWKAPRLQDLARQFSREAAPHPARKETPEVVRGVLRDRLTRFIQSNPEFLEAPPPAAPPRPVPGAPRAAPLSREAFAWVNGQVVQLERLLFDGAGGCAFCHQEKTARARRPDGLPAYRPSDIPARWFEHGLFGHRSHQMLACTECHPAPQSEQAADVLLPRIASCQQCHNPRVGARTDCVECHVYHDPAQRKEFRGPLTIGGAAGR
jgi:hypothetical protein